MDGVPYMNKRFLLDKKIFYHLFSRTVYSKHVSEVGECIISPTFFVVVCFKI